MRISLIIMALLTTFVLSSAASAKMPEELQGNWRLKGISYDLGETIEVTDRIFAKVSATIMHLSKDNGDGPKYIINKITVVEYGNMVLDLTGTSLIMTIVHTKEPKTWGIAMQIPDGREILRGVFVVEQNE